MPRGGHLESVDGGGNREPLQLTLNVYKDGQAPKDVNGEPERPRAATIGIGGKLELDQMYRELYQDEPVRVIILASNGDVVAEGEGAVVGAGTKRKTTSEVSYLVREQRIKLG